MQLYPDWSSRANTQRGKKRKRKQETTDGGTALTPSTNAPAPASVPHPHPLLTPAAAWPLPAVTLHAPETRSYLLRYHMPWEQWTSRPDAISLRLIKKMRSINEGLSRLSVDVHCSPSRSTIPPSIPSSRGSSIVVNSEPTDSNICRMSMVEGVQVVDLKFILFNIYRILFIFL